MRARHLAAILVFSFLAASSRTALAESPILVKKKGEGNYELECEVGAVPWGFLLFFSADEKLSEYGYLKVSSSGIELGRHSKGKSVTWRRYKAPEQKLPWKVRLLKKGNFFRFQVGDRTGWIRGPSGEWLEKYEPRESWVGLKAPGDTELRSLTLTTLPWLQQLTRPVIPRGPDGSFYEKQAIPGALIKFKGKYYLYFMAGMEGNEEGSSRRSIGVATSPDMRNWKVHPAPVVRNGEPNIPHDNVYPNGAVLPPEGKIALMYSVQKYPEWVGFGLALADNPLGPFKHHEANPVYKHFTHAHEFDLVRVDGPEYRYLLFYAGYTPKPRTGLSGDRGYLLYSDDLVHWREDKRNPVFRPETLDDWDAIHVRPRSLTKQGDTWYLWYEGCNTWKPEGSDHHGWWDTVGLARSKDLVKWEYYPRNPALPGLSIGPNRFDSKWTGWPRMRIEGETAYIFYTGNAMTGMRTIAVKDLVNWKTEGGKTLKLWPKGR